ncbi:3-deoxy-D-manno-octulosonic acid transferase [Enterovibrio norvegicus FF-162]|uniref:lipid IV(A) 3-deoxy-D-manno-octulosonic acid transferase n=1 Tax=Enterovibrio norvegicus TaxID=188144 RepID=UPI00031A6089|nr:lipid IV(A) 3-deoxy-D-manno-octulosonic acid transferase [Enterovibrio norvegicus]OEE74578.1 3-deoxy-D-manno-octulosonic acid transferase [Enterovibrio norvegicus FF-162]
MRLLYTLLLFIAAPFLLLGLYRAKDGKPRVGKRWVEHFGRTPALVGQRPIWIHAVSVGEVIAAKPIILALRKTYPDASILVTTTTTTGAAIASKLGEGIEHRYMPIDFGFAVSGFLKRMNPKIMLIMETELWPNTLTAVKQAGIPIIVMNARLSEKSMRGYQRVQPLFNLLSNNIDHILCQFKDDAHRFIQLGVNSQHVSVSGSVKFDLPEFDESNHAVVALKQALKQRPVWVAASTHPGEDEILLDAHQALLAKQPDALLVLVPRHPERFGDVAALIEQKGFSLSRRSQSQPINDNTQVYLGDTMGEMMTLLATSTVTFMAGSLMGEKLGGHNLLEPASLGKPQITGPSYFNFQVIGDQLIEAGACEVQEAPSDIANALLGFMNNPEKCQQAGEAALNVVERNRGAVAKTLEAIAPWIDAQKQ